MFAIFIVKGFATYGHMVLLARAGNTIVAENQRRMFANLIVTGGAVNIADGGPQQVNIDGAHDRTASGG